MGIRVHSLVFVLIAWITITALEPTLLSAQIVLKWKLKEGQVLTQVMEMKTSTRATFGGNQIETSHTMTNDVRWTVNKVDGDGKADLVQKTERIQLKLTLPGAEALEYDSKKGGEIGGLVGPMLDPIFKAILENEIQFQMSSSGKVESVVFPEKLLKAFQSVGEPKGAGGFLESTLKQTFEKFPSFPAEPISPGKNWDRHMKIPFPFGTLHSHETFTYAGAEKKNGRELHGINLKSNLSLLKDPAQPVEMKLKPNEGSGVAYFDLEAGRLAEFSQSRKIEIEVTAGNAGSGMERLSEIRIKFDEKARETKAAPEPKGKK